MPKALGVHADAVVADGNPAGCDIDPNLGRIGIVGVIDEFAEEFDALRVETFADGNDMTFIDRNFEVLLLDDIHKLSRFDFNRIRKPGQTRICFRLKVEFDEKGNPAKLVGLYIDGTPRDESPRDK